MSHIKVFFVVVVFFPTTNPDFSSSSFRVPMTTWQMNDQGRNKQKKNTLDLYGLIENVICYYGMQKSSYE